MLLALFSEAVIITLDYALHMHGRIVRLITYFMYMVAYVGQKMESIQGYGDSRRYVWLDDGGWMVGNMIAWQA